MVYSLVWHEKVKGDLKALTKREASRLLSKIDKSLSSDPCAAGKPLKGVFKGLFRYRVGDQRIIYAVDHGERRVLILHVKNRKDVYPRVGKRILEPGRKGRDRGQ